MDGAVDEDAAGELGVLHKEARRVELVAGLRAEHGGAADEALAHLLVRIAVRGVKAPREAAHDFLVGELFLGFAVCGYDGL